ncbi:MAG: hypothetical protein H6Q72_4906 [Firmicutes bacterium]|nr:hypothetical protein [Bacillota bacterium]
MVAGAVYHALLPVIFLIMLPNILSKLVSVLAPVTAVTVSVIVRLPILVSVTESLASPALVICGPFEPVPSCVWVCSIPVVTSPLVLSVAEIERPNTVPAAHQPS